MKKVWIEVLEWDKNLITDALENGTDAFIVTGDEFINKINELARADVYDVNKLPENIFFLKINSKEDEIRASRIPESVTLVIETGDWKIIPFENLIAQRGNIIASVSNLADAIEALGILEKGVDGVLLRGCSSDEKISMLKKIKSVRGSIDLDEGEIIAVEKIITGDRVCIDTITNMVEGEGMLIGDYSNGMVLVNSESLENPYVASRPFRINAGAVHCYVMTPGGRTKYLADLRSGDEALIVNQKGETFNTVIGRVKMEKRPMLRITVKGKLKDFSVVLQNAETIRIVTPDGKSKSVVKLAKGDKISIFEEKGGRHFGHKIEESIEEK
jgi:3-dehydroquinate synthase II